MKSRLVSVLVALTISSALPVLADPIPLSPNGLWSAQYELMGASGETFAYEYVATQNETLLISGYYENSDRYRIFVDGSLALTTTVPPGPITDYGDKSGLYTEPSNATFSSGLFSTGVLNVTTGDVLSIVDIGRLYPDGGSFDAQVGILAAPEPGTVALVGWCLASVIAFWRRRRGMGNESAV